MNIFITGTTGLLGGELLINLSKRKDVDKIYCLIRSATKREAIQRLEKVFSLHDDYFDKEKVNVIPGDLTDEDLTGSLIRNQALDDINVIIHSAANTSFSRLQDKFVENINIHGLNKVVQWAKQLRNLSTFLYVGTATICGKDIKNRVIFEDESPNINSSHLVRYTYTKMQGELLLRRELPQDKILVVRPSIIMGDSRNILPRSPVILWAVMTINSMRLCMFNPNSDIDIISVDFAAEAIEKILFTNRKFNVYHISSGFKYSTTPLKLALVMEPYFTDLPPYKFIPKETINKFKLWSKGIIDGGNGLSEYSEYCSHFENIFGKKENLRIVFSGLEPYIEFIELGHIFDNSRLLNEIDIAPPVPAHDYLHQSFDYMKKIDILEGAYNP
jgi:nucleoside-diphosphate-sugar epimerase